MTAAHRLLIAFVLFFGAMLFVGAVFYALEGVGPR